MEQATNKKALAGIFAFCFGAMANNMTLGIVAYIMQTYSDVSTTTVALIMTVPSLVAMVYAFFVGTLNQKLSAKSLLIFGQVTLFLMGMIFLFFGGKVSVYVLIAAAGLAGFAQGSSNTLLGVLLLSAVPDDKKRSNVLGICISTMSIGGVLFTTAGGVLAVSRWQNAFLLYFVIAALIVLELFLLPTEKPVAPAGDGVSGKKKASGKLPAMVWFISAHYLIFFLALYVFGLNVSEYVITTYKLGNSVQSGIAASLVTAGGVVAGLLFGQYSKWLGKFCVPVLMGLTVIALYLPLTYTTNVMSVYIAGLLLGFAMNGTNPFIISKLAEIVSPELYPKAMSIYSGFMNAGMCVAVYVIAFFTQMISGDGTNVHYKFLVGTIGAALCFVTAFPIYLAKDKKQAVSNTLEG